MELEDFLTVVKRRRRDLMPSPKAIVVDAIEGSVYGGWPADEVRAQPSEFLLRVRELCWAAYLEREREFNADVGATLARSASGLSDEYTPVENVVAFLYEYADHLFELSKSNTNSRRSRAGKEFEAIVESLLARAGVVFDNQGVIGSPLFKSDRLGKLVDCVIPGVVEYERTKRDCILLSMKTSLRERWQEVVEEMRRTGASEMTLLTLDDSVSSKTIENLSTHNIALVVPDDLKAEQYSNEPNVYGLSWLVERGLEYARHWEQQALPPEFVARKRESLRLRLSDLTEGAESLPFERLARHYAS